MQNGIVQEKCVSSMTSSHAEANISSRHRAYILKVQKATVLSWTRSSRQRPGLLAFYLLETTRMPVGHCYSGRWHSDRWSEHRGRWRRLPSFYGRYHAWTSRGEYLPRWISRSLTKNSEDSALCMFIGIVASSRYRRDRQRMYALESRRQRD